MFWKDKFGWLDGTTMTRISGAELDRGYDHTFTLSSRNEPVVARLNCIQFLDIWVELNVNTDRGAENPFYDDFDTGLRGSGVVIHQQRAPETNRLAGLGQLPDAPGAETDRRRVVPVALHRNAHVVFSLMWNDLGRVRCS